MITNYFDKNTKYHVKYFKTPLGEMTAVSDDDALVYLRFGHQKIFNSTDEPNHIIEQTIREINEYFDGKRKKFTVPLKVKASEFQKKAIEEIKKIDYGKTSTYGEIATKLGKKTYARGVGATCRGNAIVIIIPCHRVVMLSEKGYYNYSDGNERKKFLLELEASHIQENKKN